MTVEHRVGDLFNQPDAEALGHGVNCEGVMGAGIAKVFAEKYPEMYREYRKLCMAGKLELGHVHLWQDTETDLYIFNMASQYLRGRNAELPALRDAIIRAKFTMDKYAIGSLALPQIGCGIGGLKWPAVVEAVEDLCGDWDRKIILVSQ